MAGNKDSLLQPASACHKQFESEQLFCRSTGEKLFLSLIVAATDLNKDLHYSQFQTHVWGGFYSNCALKNAGGIKDPDRLKGRCILCIYLFFSPFTSKMHNTKDTLVDGRLRETCSPCSFFRLGLQPLALESIMSTSLY